MWTKPGYQPPPGPTPPEPTGTELATFDRGQGKVLRVSLDRYEGHPFVNLRLWENGWPVKGRGISLRIGELEGLKQAIDQVADMASQGAKPIPPWEAERPLFVEKHRRTEPVSQERRETFPVPRAGDQPFDEFGDCVR